MYSSLNSWERLELALRTMGTQETTKQRNHMKGTKWGEQVNCEHCSQNWSEAKTQAKKRKKEEKKKKKMGSSVNLATQEQMVEARISLGSRDRCSKLLIPLNRCRVDSFYLPWKCEDERHGYEKCEYDLFLQRTEKMQELREPQLQHATQ